MTDEEPKYRVINGCKVYSHYKPEIQPETKEQKLDSRVLILISRIDDFDHLKALYRLLKKREEIYEEEELQ